MWSPHRVRRAALLAVPGLLSGSLLGLLLALAGAGPAAAHATLLTNDPADGALLAEAPPSVTLTFDEPVQIRAEGVQVLDAGGSTIDVTARSVDSTVVIDLPTGLADGTYVVSWRVVSADSHPVAGGFSFAIGAPTAGSVAIPVTEPDLALRVLRPATEALLYVGVLGGTGLAVFGLSFLPIPARRRQLPTVVGLGVVALVAVAVMPPVTTAWQDAADVGALAGPAPWRTGYLSDLGLAAALTAAGVLAVLVGARLGSGGAGAARRPAGVAVFAGAGLALGASALVGHTRSFGPAWLTLGSDLLHLVTAAVWLGGILGLGHLLSRRTDTPSATQRAGVVAAFSQTAALLVALLAVAGVLLGWRIVGSWSALLGTTYGLVLLGKVAAVAVLVGIAGWNRYLLVPRTRRPDTEAAALRSLRRTVRAEAVLLVGVLAVTGVLVTRDPTNRASETDNAATGSADGRTSSVEQAVVADAALGDGRVQIRITPGATGINALELALFDVAGQPLEPVTPPTVTVTLPEAGVGPLERRLAQTGPGSYEAVADFPLPGSWEVTVNARTSRFDSPIAIIPVEIR
ncbi:copper resistance protein CopC [Solwaraspora sp. WMMA2080]|uniref:copper resistance CopC/CopD family protein n=1 Tax=unclassified Solwaraspora TaxID=2627926 RepID=UPI00248B4BE0|nr:MULTISPECIES: copper resistance protein CopC [unclassified Solwaraspora]WBB98050.1 copper resistance protein CopC [Solwaraspora sp. WMMA2059]WBC23396.1 copper resistance protein CopC [Solwaraspora sp. WMMA2080]